MLSILFLGLWGLFQLGRVHQGAWGRAADLSLALEYLYSLRNFAKLEVPRYVLLSEGGMEVRRGHGGYGKQKVA